MIKNRLSKFHLGGINLLTEDRSWIIEGDDSDDDLMNKTQKILHDKGFRWCTGESLDNQRSYSRTKIWYFMYDTGEEDQTASKGIRCISDKTRYDITEENKEQVLYINRGYLIRRYNPPIYKASDIIKRYGI